MLITDTLDYSEWLAYVAKQASFQTLVSSDRLERFAQAIQNDAPIEVAVNVECVKDRSQEYGAFNVLKGVLKAEVELACQRCLSNLDYSLESQFRVIIVDSQLDYDRLPKEFDSVVVDSEEGINVLEIIEDELLMALPFTCYHSDINDCDDAYLFDDSDNEPLVEEKKPNPFAVLETLKKTT